MGFSPVKASEVITEKYTRYLRTIFELENETYQKQFLKCLSNPKTLAAGPYLDVADSFVKGKSIEDLIRSGLLSKEFRHVAMPLSRPLYLHQEAAIQKAITGKNLIVSTGTGSGKTESFLIPVLNAIFREYESGTLQSGVRALLIYPMNALANDQIELLRGLLADCPEVTYGSYTGQTKGTYADALAEYKQLNEGKMPAGNELISRDQMKDTPPHILITNYAMLEYLMVRPGDSAFFRGDTADKWKFIVLDEAHVYNGSSGIEVSMLLRRLKARLQNDHITYILTSATLGDEKSNQAVAEFGQNLCNSLFETENIVRAFRTKPVVEHESHQLPMAFYQELSDLYDRDATEQQLLTAMDKYGADIGKTSEEKLYDLILHDVNYQKLKEYTAATKTVHDISDYMGWTESELTAFVTTASHAERNGDKLFDAKYHMFLRATESVFITLAPSRKLFLTRKKEHVEPDGTHFKVFEIATCNICHAIYLLGAIKEDHLEQSNFKNEDELRSVFLLKDEISDTDDDHTLEEEGIQTEEYEICPRCGFIRRAGLAKNVQCEHDAAQYIKLQKVQVKSESGVLTKCPACENTNSSGILRMFFTGQEAVTSVIGTALFEELPSYKTIVKPAALDEDDFDFGDSTEVTEMVEEAKQFIAFSDNRQAAAFYASYLDRTYRNMLYKRLIVETLNTYASAWRGASIPDFAIDLADQFKRHRIETGERDCEREAWKAILQELVDNNGITSLYNMGLLYVTLNPELMGGLKKLNLSKEDVCTLCNVMILGVLADAAISYPCTMQMADKEFFTHNGIEYSYTLSDPDPKAYRRAFIPRFTDKDNKRANYFKRVLEKMGTELSQREINEILGKFWNGLLVKKGYMKQFQGSYKVDVSKLIIMRPAQWYLCPKCRKLTPYNLHNVCPTYKCTGTLVPVDLDAAMADNHYYQMYHNMDIRKLRVVEHTAQLSKETAYEYQKKFKNKEIDILSCSTTFEMGVDVGSLETVFMRNMPPSPANYAQRAGRAGRSKQSAAFALTFCNKSNHDFAFFLDPTQMIKGRIDPPKFVVENEKIAVRHIYASALSFFWREHSDYFSKTSKMTEDDEEGNNGIQLFKKYLMTKPAELKDYLKRFLPKALWGTFDVENFGWLDRLFSTDEDSPGVLTKAAADYEYEVSVLQKAKEIAQQENRPVDHLTDRIKVYQNEAILTFLSRKNVMPKYGFPVDTVELSIPGGQSRGKLGLQLQRDLSMAISEYAPGSQIVADGNLITSRYIKKIPKMSWKMFDYIMCDCRTLNIEPHTGSTLETTLKHCRQCGAELNQNKRRTFLIPEFGFQADPNKIEKPGLKKPMKTYRGEVAYVGYRTKLDIQQYQIGDALVEVSMSRGDEMAVINESNFFVCTYCGFTDLDEKDYRKTKRMVHKTASGHRCYNDGTNTLRRYSLGYRFETDVFQLHFIQPDLTEWETAVSVLYGVLRGICRCLNIEDGDISGCVQYSYNEAVGRSGYALIFYDTTPGGAGHVRRLENESVLKNVLKYTLKLMEQCTCGGEKQDSSCYACLRSYANQKYHDILNRGLVIDFIKSLHIE